MGLPNAGSFSRGNVKVGAWRWSLGYRFGWRAAEARPAFLRLQLSIRPEAVTLRFPTACRPAKVTPNALPVSAADSRGPQVVKAAAHALWRSRAPHASIRVGVADVTASPSTSFARRDHPPNSPLLPWVLWDRVPYFAPRTQGVHPISFAGKASAPSRKTVGTTEVASACSLGTRGLHAHLLDS